jgi:hypothetical protein
MQQNLLNAEFAFVAYRNAKNKYMHVLRVMKALTKVLLKCFCCICANRQSDFLGNEAGICAEKAFLSPPL